MFLAPNRSRSEDESADSLLGRKRRNPEVATEGTKVIVSTKKDRSEKKVNKYKLGREARLRRVRNLSTVSNQIML